MSKLHRAKLYFEKLPRDTKKYLHYGNAYASIRAYSLKEREPMSNKKQSTKPTKKEKRLKRESKRAIDTLLSISAQSILAFYALEKLMTADNDVVRGVVGFSIAYIGLTVGYWVYKFVIVPVSAAIVENQ